MGNTFSSVSLFPSTHQFSQLRFFLWRFYCSFWGSSWARFKWFQINCFFDAILCIHKLWKCGLLPTQQTLPSYQTFLLWEVFGMNWTLGHCFSLKFQGTHFKHSNWYFWNPIIGLRWITDTPTYFLSGILRTQLSLEKFCLKSFFS